MHVDIPNGCGGVGREQKDVGRFKVNKSDQRKLPKYLDFVAIGMGIKRLSQRLCG